MHTIQLYTPLCDDRWDLPNGEYLCEDLTAAEICIAAKRGQTRINYPPFLLCGGGPIILGAGMPIESANTLLISNGGFGDMLMLTPALRAFKAKWPDRKLTLSTRARVHLVFDGIDFAPTLADYPFDMRDLSQFDRLLTTEHLQEDSEEGRTIPAIDIKARVLGVGPLVGDQRKSAYTMRGEEIQWANQKYPHGHRQRIGIQIKSSSPTRDLHAQRMGEILTRLYDKGREIYLLGTAGMLPSKPFPDSKRDLIKDITRDGLTFRESAAVATTCDVMLTPDSSFMHLCGALDIPCVAIFGSTAWKLRSADYKSVTAIQGHGPCSPCWHHPKGHEIFPRGEMCEKMGYCGPMHMIQADQIVAAVEKKLK